MKKISIMLVFTLFFCGCDTYKGQIKHNPDHHDSKNAEQKSKNS